MLKICLFLAVVFISFPTNASDETCSFFTQKIQASYGDYIKVKNTTGKRAGSSVSFDIVGIENHALQNLNNNIQIYRNLDCDVGALRQDMDKTPNGGKKGSSKNDRR